VTIQIDYYFLVHIPRPPHPTLFPYTTLFRSRPAGELGLVHQLVGQREERRQEAGVFVQDAWLLDRRAGRQAWWQQQAVLLLQPRSEEHTSELQSQSNLVCRLLLEKKKKKNI